MAGRLKEDGAYVTTDGVVHRFEEYEDGTRREWTEPLADSPTRDFFAALDPHQPTRLSDLAGPSNFAG